MQKMFSKHLRQQKESKAAEQPAKKEKKKSIHVLYGRRLFTALSCQYCPGIQLI
jgi:hypothetical protein